MEAPGRDAGQPEPGPIGDVVPGFIVPDGSDLVANRPAGKFSEIPVTGESPLLVGLHVEWGHG